ncbi:hypothetical protein J7I98_23540 [Streptomyces sp. ISL-98]|uniref:hypothetical protein n=1 Tax=Streptomyces sp. ISL-98 TaxID=2819192 RepID=UPI001BE91299|nr:hypothetical protein [Streptomyces sp. ISL-98]MBT2508804.1 hypothetical protein [Streptomyces sp. ISL-98]
MAKSGGLGDNFYIAGYDISGDLGSINTSGGPAALVVTGIDKSAFERIGGLRTGGMSWSTWFNTATGRAHERLSALPTADVITSYHQGTTLANPAAACVAKQINYDPSRGDDGSLTFAVNVESNAYGLEWGVQGTAGKRTDTAATAAAAVTAVDGGASSAFGLQAYLHVFSFTGTSCTVKLQESSDNGADAYVDVVGGAFTAATGVTSQRIATAAGLTVERYLKVVTTGTFSECTFAVIICRNDTAVTF